MIKTHNNKIYLLLFLTIFAVNIKTIYAADYSFNYSQSDGEDGGTGQCTGTANCPENITACCSISTGYNISHNINVDAYDMNGNRIDKGLFVYQDTLAGTFVGINIYEVKSYNSWANYSVSAIQTYYNCTHITYGWVCSIWYNNSGQPQQSCRWVATSRTHYEALYGCNTGDFGPKETRPATPCAEKISACAARAKPPVIQLEPSYKAVYQDSNDIDSKESTDEYNTAEIVNGGACNTPRNSSSIKNPYSGSASSSQTCNFYYNRQKTCINVKTGKVRYINNNEKCYPTTDEKNPEYEIKSENGYWKYFVPLNATSGEDFSFSLDSSGNIQHAGICYDVINKYDDYDMIIAGPNNEVLPKITSGMNQSEIRKTKQEAKNIVKKGCRYQTRITIPVEQKFYNELENGINFNGFNFYYKPIDINEPFPNGINETSLWYEWNNNNKKDPDLTKSYNEVTYIAQINNVNKIREYTKDNPYTNWYTMYVNGTSSYIENSGVITRYVDRDSYYPLGCGPINENEYTDASKKVRNVFYQKECSK